MDSKVYPISEYEVGITAPPFHVNCRSTTAPYFDDDKDAERVARDKDGKNYKVNGMTYNEWYDKFVKTNPGELIAEKMWQNRFSDKNQFEKYKGILGKELPETFEKFQELKYNDSKEYEQLKREYRTISEIESKTWSNEFKEKAKKLYYGFKRRGFESSSHFLARFLQREDEDINLEKVIDILNKPINYKDAVSRKNIRYYELLRIVTNENDTEIITVVKNKIDVSNSKLKEGVWIKNE